MKLRRKRKSFDNEEDLGRWLLTYADLITLLLAFFIVMYSMSQIDAKKFGKVAKALHGVLKGGEDVLRRNWEEQQTEGHGLLKLGDLRMINMKIQERFKKLGRREELQTEITERGLVVHIMESALFKEGSAALEFRAVEVLDLIYDEIKKLPNHVRIEGHTDDRAINTLLYPSNWELSAARATAVVRYFIENHDIPPDKISALGYGEFRPKRPNNSIENRAHNRRIDVLILTMELSLKEPSSQLYYITADK
ncbi:MAG: flagellar motor protein MotB [candidate division Zixibacteria bacterium]|nr:flagellar motor protein MotB [candidate division Zixibacteria bacterium]